MGSIPWWIPAAVCAVSTVSVLVVLRAVDRRDHGALKATLITCLLLTALAGAAWALLTDMHSDYLTHHGVWEGKTWHSATPSKGPPR